MWTWIRTSLVPGRHLPRPSRRAGAMKWAYRTILTLISATLLVLIVAMARQPRPQSEPHPQDQPSVGVDPNEAEPDPMPDEALEPRAERQWEQFLERMRLAPLPQTNAAIERQIDKAFAPVYERIPAFLDWHYSIVGQYTELGQAALGALEEAIESRLFGELPNASIPRRKPSAESCKTKCAQRSRIGSAASPRRSRRG